MNTKEKNQKLQNAALADVIRDYIENEYSKNNQLETASTTIKFNDLDSEFEIEIHGNGFSRNFKITIS